MYVFIIRISISTSKGEVIEPWRLALEAFQNMASISDTDNWSFEYAAEIYTKQAMLSKDYELFL